MAFVFRILLKTIVPLPFVLLVLVISCPGISAAEKKGFEGVGCDIHSNPCTGSLPDCQVTLDIQPKPVKAMRDLTFIVTLSGKKPAAVPHIDLGMPGMNMGPNRVSLKALGKGVYEGKGVIVRCPSGRRTCKATVTVPESGSVGFIFDVVY